MTPIVTVNEGNERMINFGKYKGCIVISVIETDPSYIQWAQNSVKGFQLTEEEKRLLMKHLVRRIRINIPCFGTSFSDYGFDDMRACFDPNY